MPALGIFSDEGEQFLGGYAMGKDNRQRTLAALNDLWQGNPIRRTRSGEGSLTLHGRRLAMHLMVQPGVARNFMADPMTADTGFLPRFLICKPPSTIGKRFHSLVQSDETSIKAFSTRMRAILETPLPMDPETRELTPRMLGVSDEARAQLIAFSDDIEARQGPGGEMAGISGYASKATEQACRIAGVLTLWRNLGAAQVTGDDMANGIALARFHLGEALRLNDEATISAEVANAERLRTWLLEDFEHAEITLRDISQVGPGPLRDSKKGRAALLMLEEHRWIQRLTSGAIVRGAARKEAWRIVGKLSRA
jgi:hypothetical protein